MGVRIPERDSQGAELVRTKITQTGWHYHLAVIELKTATADSLYYKDYNGDNLSGTTVKFYNAANKLRMIAKHPAGLQKDLCLFVEMYRQ